MRRVIFVVGVHRSGTSVLAAAMQAMGCAMGVLNPAQSDENPDGFFENLAAVRLNDRVLAAFGGAWDNWAMDARGDVTPFVPDAAAVLSREAGTGEAPLAVKDPRMTLLLPLWLRGAEVAGMRPEVVMALRDPGEVAQSQAARAAAAPTVHATLPDAASMAALWCLNMYHLLNDLPEDGAYLLRHADLMADPAGVLARLATDLALPGGEQAARGFARDRVQPVLYRARGGAAVAPGWPVLAARLHARLAGPGGNRRMPPAEAAAALAEVPELAALIPYLPATRASISGLSAARTLLKARAAQVPPLRRALRAVVAGLSQSDDPAAFAALATALDAMPGAPDPDIDALRALVAERMGQAEAAEALLRRALARMPEQPQLWQQLISVLRASGRIDAAEAARAGAATRLPGNPAFRPPA